MICTGDKLANGARVLKIRKHHNGGFVVLCKWFKPGEMSYVTWRCTRRDDTSWGHYYADLIDANKDYLTR
jgi:hypothetical protein